MLIKDEEQIYIVSDDTVSDLWLTEIRCISVGWLEMCYAWLAKDAMCIAGKFMVTW